MMFSGWQWGFRFLRPVLQDILHETLANMRAKVDVLAAAASCIDGALLADSWLKLISTIVDLWHLLSPGIAGHLLVNSVVVV